MGKNLICGIIDNHAVYRFVFSPMESNMYAMVSGMDALIIDPIYTEETECFFGHRKIKNATILLTHEHYDHVSGVNQIRDKCNCTVVAHSETKKVLEQEDNDIIYQYNLLWMFHNNQEMDEIDERSYNCSVDRIFTNTFSFIWHKMKIELTHTPGHSPGSSCVIVNRNNVFTGDSLVEGKKIITRLPGGSKNDYMLQTRGYLKALPSDAIIFPGHGNPGEISSFEIL
ncbi:MAG: MBL fold metallo-hydrolase [Lachnospiraceae bacterium]